MIEWYTKNENRSYPVAEDATQRAVTGDRLSQSIIVDMSIMVPEDYRNLYLKSVYVSDYIVNVTICAENDTGIFAIGSGGFLRDDIEAGKAYPLSPLLEQVSGWLVFGSQLTNCDLTFNSYEDAKLDPKAVTAVAPLGVEYISAVNQQARLQEVITLEAGTNVIIEPDPMNQYNILVRLEDPTILQNECDTQYLRELYIPPIFSINNVQPDEDGKLTIEFGADDTVDT